MRKPRNRHSSGKRDRVRVRERRWEKEEGREGTGIAKGNFAISLLAFYLIFMK